MLKRILSCVLAVVLTLSALPMTAIAETVSRRYGDVNQDGSIDLKDVLILKRCLGRPCGHQLVRQLPQRVHPDLSFGTCRTGQTGQQHQLLR